jgi:chromatin segregation and condensation protein Rec8/ScpA/Scc1 (kleisin family)
MTDQNAEFRDKAISTRRLEIAATLARWKSDYFNQGVERPIGDRASLEAELAELTLEQRLIGDAVQKAKVERRQKINASLLAQLQVVLTERGLTDALEEAQRRSDALCVEVQHLPADDTEGGAL